MTGHRYRAVVHVEPEGGYWAEVPDLPGCFTQGETLEELYRNLTEAIACHALKEEVRLSLEAADQGEILSQEEMELLMAKWLES